jgi:myo-inositol catabolism protein IolC
MTIVPLRDRRGPDAICANIVLAAVDNHGLVVVGLEAARPLLEAGFLEVVPCDWVDAPLAALQITDRGWRAYLEGRLVEGAPRGPGDTGGARQSTGGIAAAVPAA